jgi:OPT family oligopeptide transporter
MQSVCVLRTYRIFIDFVNMIIMDNAEIKKSEVVAMQVHEGNATVELPSYSEVSEQMCFEDCVSTLTPQTDDPATLAFTFRSVYLGCVLAVFLSCGNVLFSFRTNNFEISCGVVQLLAYPLGILWARVVPKRAVWLNPGPFTIKEHVVIYAIASAAGGAPYGIDAMVAQKSKLFMDTHLVNVWNSLAWVATTQLIGFGIAAITRRFLVRPSQFIWPSVLPAVAFFTTLNGVNTMQDHSPLYPMSRYSFFKVAFIIVFLYSWIPAYLLPSLSAVSVICLLTRNKTARFLGSAHPDGGVGILSFSFDWYTIF